MISNKQKAFTLIELLVVVAIIGILAAVGVVAYSGYTKNAKKVVCLENSKFFKNELLRKWMHGQMQNTPDITFTGGYCFLHWLPSYAYLTPQGSNIVAQMKANNTINSFCLQEYAGAEHFLADHFYGMGYRNPFYGNHGSFNTKAALGSPARDNTLYEGGSVLRCGANAGLTDKYKCKIITMCELGQTTEITIEAPR